MQKRHTEEQTRKKLMEYATAIGSNYDLEQLFKKWDLIILTLPPQERKEASRLAILEIQSLLDIHAEEGDGLTINGEVVINPAKIKNPKMKW